METPRYAISRSFPFPAIIIGSPTLLVSSAYQIATFLSGMTSASGAFFFMSSSGCKGSSKRGLSKVNITLLHCFDAMQPIVPLFLLSLSPPYPITIVLLKYRSPFGHL
ncbi:hypothetical protein JOD03_000184 [Chryseomicrobium aureum]|nr:hypothetical protein [Chryseomicrobium aureum]MBM7705301.1 hypothetical protein [Chryseomicrobium aureum]